MNYFHCIRRQDRISCGGNFLAEVSVVLGSERINELKKKSSDKDKGLSELSRKVFWMLLEANGNPLSNELLKNQVWNTKNVQDGALQQHVSHIRKFLKSNDINDISIPDALDVEACGYCLSASISSNMNGIHFGPFELRRGDVDHIYKSGARLDCSGNQRLVLEKLLEARGQPIDLEVLKRGWNEPADIDDETVRTSLEELAQTISGADPQSDVHIQEKPILLKAYCLQYLPENRRSGTLSFLVGKWLELLGLPRRFPRSADITVALVILGALAAVLIHVPFWINDRHKCESYYWTGMGVLKSESRKPDDVSSAIHYFEKARDIYPKNARAYAEMANTYSLLSMYGATSPVFARDKAVKACDEATRLDPDIPESKTCAAEILDTFDWNFSAADKQYQAAISAGPDYFTAHHFYSTCLVFEGKLDQAYQESLKAQKLDPESKIAKTAGAWILIFQGKYQDAIKQLKPLVDADFEPARWRLALAYELSGDTAKGLDVLKDVEKLKADRDIPALATRAYILALSGNPPDKKDARAILKTLYSFRGKPGSKDYVSPYWTAVVQASLHDNNNNEAFSELIEARDLKDSWFPYILADPIWSPLQADPRFTELRSILGASTAHGS